MSCLPLTCIPSCCLGKEDNYKKGMMYLQSIPQNYDYLGEKYGQPYQHEDAYFKAFNCFMAVINETKNTAFKHKEAQFELGKIVLGKGTFGPDHFPSVSQSLTGRPLWPGPSPQADVSSLDIALGYLDQAARIGHVGARNLASQYRKSDEYKRRHQPRAQTSYQSQPEQDVNDLLKQLIQNSRS
ncbi:MAG: hypothetical protein JSS32_08700 [Verrucomicrobia bacterium]|nr:hypothetical protein [Verrucomicrobiota bacterium]